MKDRMNIITERVDDIPLLAGLLIRALSDLSTDLYTRLAENSS
jgi:hypothetical protein